MKFTRLLLVVFFITAFSEATFAFDICEEIVNDPDELSRVIGDAVILRAPVGYHSLARSIKLVTKGSGEKFIPFAADLQDTKFVVIPPVFAKAMCNIVLARFLSIEGIQQETFDQEASIAAKCLDAGGSQKECLVGFSNELAKRYRKAYSEQPDKHRNVAFGIYESTLNQVMMHEYAHHFLDHFARIRMQKITRVDAEFEADLFAALNGVQAAEPPSAMYYFFKGLADIERYTKRLSTEDYESAFCRSKNVENITGHISAMPIFLLDASLGGGYYLSRNSPSAIRSFANKDFPKEPPDLLPESCGRLAKIMMDNTFQELRQLYLRMEKDLEFLFDREKDVDIARANSFLRDLSKMSGDFRYMNGIAAKSVALMLRGWGLKGRNLAPIIGQIDRLLGNSAVTDNFLSEDFGRLLHSQALAILQERTDLAPQSRLDQSFSILQRSVYYNPALSESWMNLAIIAFKQGDCASAGRFAIHASETNSEDEMRKASKQFADSMVELSRNPETCKARGAAYHPYPGL
jgi:hypothetical protein